MDIKFWGTRGSIPTAIPAQEIEGKIRSALQGAAGLDLSDQVTLNRYIERLPITVRGTTGGNTSCIQIQSGDQHLIIDAGSGIRLLGLDLMEQGFAHDHYQADILITHTHWDHIHGWPFFQPAFVPDNRFTFHSPFYDLAERLSRQQDSTFFPVPLSCMSASLKFNKIDDEQWTQLGDFRVYPLKTSHPGAAYGYRIENGQTCLVCATDSEYKRLDPLSTKKFVKFFQDADLLVFDAQYNLTEVLDKPDWGHSTPMMGAELAYRANVKRLALFHHDPTSSDDKVWAGKEQAEAYLLHRHPHYNNCEVLVAYDGLQLTI